MSAWKLYFSQSASFRPYGADDVTLVITVEGRKKHGTIARYLKAGWGLFLVEQAAS